MMFRRAVAVTVLTLIVCVPIAFASGFSFVEVRLQRVDFSLGYPRFDGTIEEIGAVEVSDAWAAFSEDWDVYRLYAVTCNRFDRISFIGGSTDNGVELVLDPGNGNAFYNDEFESSLIPPNTGFLGFVPTLAFDTYLSMGGTDIFDVHFDISNEQAFNGLTGEVNEFNVGWIDVVQPPDPFLVRTATGQYRKLLGQFTVPKGSDFFGQARLGGVGLNVFAFYQFSSEFLSTTFGSCCIGSVECTWASQSDCATLGGVFQGVGTSCDVTVCLGPTGACCLSVGCVEIEKFECNDLGGTYLGDDVPCTQDDADNDGVPDACDACPDDPMKFMPGRCGCGVMDDRSDITAITSFGIAGDDGVGEFTFPVGIALALSGDVYVTDVTTDQIHIFDSVGQPKSFAGAGPSDPNEIERPVDLALTSNRMYVVDQENHRINVRELDGTPVQVFGAFGDSNAQFSSPSGIALTPDGRVFVADTGNNRIQVFEPDGSFVETVTVPESGVGPILFGPRGLHIDREGRLLIVDTFNQRVLMTMQDGTLLKSLGPFGPEGEDDFSFPLGVTSDFAGRIYVSDAGNSRVVAFDRDGEMLWTFGGPGSGSGEFDGMQRIAATADGRLYVTDAGGFRVQVLDVPTLDACPADCAPDRGNGVVSIDDLMAVINAFGEAGGACDVAPTNLDGSVGNGAVNIDDVIAVITSFGPCPDVCGG
ncbi:MAG: SMP-30/gluconolactonase/LRE family protein [Planctomycetota bacterium]